jgi:hypothetical protein
MTTNSLYGIPAPPARSPSAEVVRWRWERLSAAGFDDRLARALAGEGDVDLHALLDLVDKGCPPHLAARIMGSRAVGIETDAHG